MKAWLGFAALTSVLAATVATASPTGSVRVAHVSLNSAPTSEASSAAAPDGDYERTDLTGCERPLPRRPPSVLRKLPWPVLFTTACGRFAAFPNGVIARTLADRAPAPVTVGYRVPAGPGAWASVQDGHVFVVENGRTTWRSVGGRYNAMDLGSAVVGRGWVAFSTYAAGDPSPLYLATGTGPERVIAHNEEPSMGASWGFVATRWRPNGGNGDLVARRSDGSLLRVVATRVAASFVEPRGTILYQKARALWRTNGLESHLLADLSSLGPRRFAGAQPLGDGRIFVSGLERIAVLGSDGRTESSATLAPVPRGGWGYLGPVAPEPITGAIVVTATRWNDESAGGGPGWEGVYLLRRGETTAQLLFGRRLNIAVCAHAASFSWHGRWLLYSACEGRAVAIDMTGQQDPVDASSVARAIPEPRDQRAYGLYGAEWAPFGSVRQMTEASRLA